MSDNGNAHLHIQLLELLKVEASGGTVLQEAFVPLLQLVLIELGALHQVIQRLRGQLAVLFPHGVSAGDSTGNDKRIYTCLEFRAIRNLTQKRVHMPKCRERRNNTRRHKHINSVKIAFPSHYVQSNQKKSIDN